jgi:hypothetical protein
MGLCFAQQKANPKSKWNCQEFARSTKGLASLPQHVQPKPRKPSSRSR